MNNGIDTDECYKYTARDGRCYFSNECIGATCIGYTVIKSGNEEHLKIAVATAGPISVVINAADNLYFYKSGIYDEASHSGDLHQVKHAMLVVGYGTEGDVDYWLVKNSWSTTWGDQGFAKVARNKNNRFGIATDAVYPTV